MRYQSMGELLKNLSPDVVVEDELITEKVVVKGDGQRALRGILEEKFYANWLALNGPTLVREHRFHNERRWRFDFAAPTKLIAFEIQGGLYAAKSGHRTKTGVERDYQKLNEAVMLGWKVFQITSADMKSSVYMQRLIDFVIDAPAVA